MNIQITNKTKKIQLTETKIRSIIVIIRRNSVQYNMRVILTTTANSLNKI